MSAAVMLVETKTKQLHLLAGWMTTFARSSKVYSFPWLVDAFACLADRKAHWIRRKSCATRPTMRPDSRRRERRPTRAMWTLESTTKVITTTIHRLLFTSKLTAFLLLPKCRLHLHHWPEGKWTRQGRRRWRRGDLHDRSRHDHQPGDKHGVDQWVWAAGESNGDQRAQWHLRKPRSAALGTGTGHRRH